MAFYDPNATIALSGEWEGGYADVDDGTRSPTAASTTDYISSWDSGTIELGFPEPVNAITNVRVWCYGYTYDYTADLHRVSLSRDGTNWTATANWPFVASGWSNRSWLYVDFPVAWAAPTDLRLRIEQYGTSGNNTIFYAVYLETTEAALSTPLPRRALDGPFYGSLRGSVR